MQKFISYWKISQFKVKTQNFRDFFVFILLIIFLTLQKIVQLSDARLIRFAFHMLY